MSSEARRKLISIVAPAYNQRDDVTELTRRLQPMFGEYSFYGFGVLVVENETHDAAYGREVESNTANAGFTPVRLACKVTAEPARLEAHLQPTLWASPKAAFVNARHLMSTHS